MSDEERQTLSDGEAADVEAVVEDKEEKQQTPSYAERQETKARGGGWKPEEEWDGDPEQWVSAEAFNIRGEFIGKLKQKDADTDQRIAQINQFNATQNKIKLDELAAEKDKLIEEGGRVAEVKVIDSQINTLNSAPVSQGVPPEIQAWNDANSWIDEPGAKSTYARTLYAEAAQRGMTPQAIINHVDQGVLKEFPMQTTQKPTVAESEKGNGAKSFGKGKEKAITMADITPDEWKSLKAMPNAWPTDKDKIQAVTDSRKTQ